MMAKERPAGIGRESLYKALRADASPRFDMIAKVCKALGVRIDVRAEHPARIQRTAISF
jgi:probable addiction module antidote protein